MNRIDKLFKEKNKNVLSIYFTAGFPALDDTTEILTALELAGVDMVEIGMPFSDPLADGPVIQDSSTKALKNGMTLKILFQQLKDIRSKVKLPILLMGYFNPVYHFGVEKFCAKCKEVGVDGIILPDLPLDEYEKEYKSVFESNGLHVIFLVSPQTDNNRIKKLDNASSGFDYFVSSYTTTGSGKGLEQSQQYFERLAAMTLKNPKMIGFGIKDKATFKTACTYANGTIIGTAFVRAIDGEGSIMDKVKRFVDTILR